MRLARLGTILLVGLVAGCGGASAPSPSASAPATSSLVPTTATSSTSALPSSSPTSVASASAPANGQIRPGSIALVVTNDLRVRSKPLVSDDSAKLTPLLQRGREVFVVDGPVAGSGFEWYQVEPVRAPDEFGDLPFGWVAAAGKDGEPWLDGAAFTCPEPPTSYRAFVELRSLIGAACFSRRDLTFAARLEQPEATCGVDIGWTVEPDWLGSTCPQPKFLIADPTTTASFYSVLDPDGDFDALHPGVDPPDWIDVDVIGHFDDPAAETCKPVSTDGTKPEIGADEAVAGCRAQFVITSIQPRG